MDIKSKGETKMKQTTLIQIGRKFYSLKFEAKIQTPKQLKNILDKHTVGLIGQWHHPKRGNTK